MRKALLLAASLAAFVSAGLPLDQSSARAEQMTCREAAKLKFPGDWKSRAAYRKACKAAWKAHRLNPQPLPPKA
jgi:hypothetical protein